MSHVLILDADQRSALAATRSLGQLGIKVHVADRSSRPLAAASRHAVQALRSPDPFEQSGQYVEWVVDTVRKLQPTAILPLTDASTMLLNPVRDALAPSVLMCAPLQTYELVSDKADLIELAAQVGVRAPRSTRINSLEELELHLHAADFPIVLKPARSRVRLGDKLVATSVTVAHSADEAREWLRGQSWLAQCSCLIQEFIAGSGAGVFAYYDNGVPYAWFAHRRLREKPPSGGVSVLSQSVEVDARLRDASERLLTGAGWSGAAMVEYKLGRDGEFYLMEVNGRLWGSLQLAIDCGVDFPALLYRSATGQRLEPLDRYALGRKLRWWLGDVDHLAIQLRDRNLNVRAKLRLVAAFLGSSLDPDARQEILRWSDPKPALTEFRTWLGALL